MSAIAETTAAATPPAAWWRAPRGRPAPVRRGRPAWVCMSMIMRDMSGHRSGCAGRARSASWPCAGAGRLRMLAHLRTIRGDRPTDGASGWTAAPTRGASPSTRRRISPACARPGGLAAETLDMITPHVQPGVTTGAARRAVPRLHPRRTARPGAAELSRLSEVDLHLDQPCRLPWHSGRAEAGERRHPEHRRHGDPGRLARRFLAACMSPARRPRGRAT